jgi:hypothetical protein
VVSTQWLGEGVGVPVIAVAPGDGLGLAAGEGHGVAEALAVGEAEPAAEGEAEGEGDAGAEAAGLTEGEAEGEAQATGGVARVRSVLLTFCALPPPLSRRAAGTTINPMTTVMTKAAAPHSRRQNPALELRIRALRPLPAGAYSWY